MKRGGFYKGSMAVLRTGEIPVILSAEERCPDDDPRFKLPDYRSPQTISVVAIQGGPRPRTDDMRIMFEDIERADPTIRLLQDAWEDRCVAMSRMALKIMINRQYGRMLA